MMKWIIRNWLTICVSLILTAIAVKAAYLDRGYIAVGSEWLVLPAVFLARAFYREAKEENRRWL